jgi:hypothetical protein
MKATSLFLAAAFALCANAAFAQTTPANNGTTPGNMTTSTPATGNVGTGTTSNGNMNNPGAIDGAGTNKTSTMDKSTMRSNRRAEKGTKMKSKTQTTGTTNTTM